MSEADLSAQVKQFISTYIDSIEKLEVLLLLRARTERTWDAESVSRELRITEASATRRLADLARHGLAEVDASTPPRYRFAPARPEDAEGTERLAEAYAERRVSVISYIFSRPLETVRGFADAFRLKRDKDDDHG